MSFSKNTYPVFFFISFALLITSASAAYCLIRNRCPYNVWAAAIPGNGGRKLETNIVWGTKMPINTTTVSIWGRTNCNGDSSKSKLSCQTGDCNGLLNCTDAGKPPFTLAKFSMERFSGEPLSFQLSLAQGFNIPMAIRAYKPCTVMVVSCTADINGKCPQEARVPGGCNNPCPGFNCSISRFLENMCTQANAYLDLGQRNEYRCPSGTSYSVTFCPPT